MQKGKILIVDDSLMNIELLEETLEIFEYEILSYSNPVDALENTAQEMIDLALIDVVMPQMDGFEFTKKFLKTHPNTPVVYVSAYGENEKKIKGYVNWLRKNLKIGLAYNKSIFTIKFVDKWRKRV